MVFSGTSAPSPSGAYYPRHLTQSSFVCRCRIGFRGWVAILKCRTKDRITQSPSFRPLNDWSALALPKRSKPPPSSIPQGSSLSVSSQLLVPSQSNGLCSSRLPMQLTFQAFRNPPTAQSCLVHFIFLSRAAPNNCASQSLRHALASP